MPYNFNPRSLAGATDGQRLHHRCTGISIHAPSRERHSCFISCYNIYNFNPRSLAGATTISHFAFVYGHNFNPRSLAGATFLVSTVIPFIQISIHAPSRERREVITNHRMSIEISIHAPSRERLVYISKTRPIMHFNPRSLAGATEGSYYDCSCR